MPPSMRTPKPPIEAPNHVVNAEALQKDKAVSLTEQDIKDFVAAHDHGAAMTDKEIADINDSWELALLHHGISPQEVRELRQTVEDAIANNME